MCEVWGAVRRAWAPKNVHVVLLVESECNIVLILSMLNGSVYIVYQLQNIILS